MTLAYQYQIYNRRQQGLAETSRLILELANASYENVFVEVLLLSNSCITLPDLIMRRIGSMKKKTPHFNSCQYFDCGKETGNG
jgi:hypothetical protein